jgi:hypothetical protein
MKLVVERDFMTPPPSCCEAVKPKLKFEIRTLFSKPTTGLQNRPVPK